MNSPTIKYRPDIDGLRAIAVLGVVLHHLSSRLMPGGFVGVDIFFVISGYLITKIIYKDITQSTFSFKEFYERRMRRIFPALFAVVCTVLFVGYFILLPSDYILTLRGAIATTVFSANIIFWKDLARGYFAADAKLNPLLHMWSLGVEEQFYLLFPIILIFLTKYRFINIKQAIAIGGIVSLALAQYFLSEKSVAVFFLLPFRAWELLVGSYLAVSKLPKPSNKLNSEFLMAIALLAMVAPMFLYTAETPFPGLSALPPVIGAAIAIHVGSANEKSFITRILSIKVVVFFGLISYSLYLWHWPIIVYAKFISGLEIPNIIIPILLALSVLAGYLSYSYIEKPFRKSDDVVPIKLLIKASILASIIIVSYSIYGINNRGLDARFNSDILNLDASRNKNIPYKECEENLLQRSGDFCIIGDTKSTPTILLWGDSHMLAWLPVFDYSLKKIGLSAYAAPNSACPPVLNINNSRDLKCKESNDSVLNKIKSDSNIKAVFMSAFWSKYFRKSNMVLSNSSNQIGNEIVFYPALLDTIKKLESLNLDVIVLGPIPTYPKDVPLILAYESMLNKPIFPKSNIEELKENNSEFYKMAAQYNGRTIFVDVGKWFCLEHCVVRDSNNSFYRDNNHINVYGAIKFNNQISELLLIPAKSEKSP